MIEMILELPLLQVVVHDEKGVLFSGMAKALSSVNDQGPFDILQEHTNFITLIKDKIEIVTETDQVKSYPVDGGILHCFTSKVEIYLGVQNQNLDKKK
jgi:F0F1-type ATP synthase epsilon subunit